jgi:hypothetical protein
MPIIIFYIDDGLYFGTSEGALDRFKKELPARFSDDFLGKAHQENNYIITHLLQKESHL